MFGLFKKNRPVVTDAAKEAAWVDMIAKLMDEGLKLYATHALLAWQDIKTLAPEKVLNEAVLAHEAFKFGFVSMGAAYAKAGTVDVDFEQNPEYASFGIEVARTMFPEEELLKAVFSAAQFPSRTKDAYETGMEQATAYTESMMTDQNLIDEKALKKILKSVFDAKSHFENLRHNAEKLPVT